MKIIAVTGGISTGKTTLVKTLRRLGAPVSDADAISRSLTAPGGKALPLIREAFGNDVFENNGTLNRRALGTIVFHSPEKKAILEGILHPLIICQVRTELEQFAREGHRAAVLDVPLLFETGMDQMADEVWCTSLPQEEQLRRLMERDGSTREEALARMASQMSRQEREKRSDVLISTIGTIEETAEIVRQAWEKSVGKGENEWK